MPRFREGTVDADCWDGIVNKNEYGLPETLDPQMAILDIGTHVGSFVQACWNRGARNIVSFEASYDNYLLATENVGHLEGVRLFNAAVTRSDSNSRSKAYFSGFVPFFDGRVNTGGGDVFSSAAQGGREVLAVTFDEIANKVDLLKLDCEGSEWPILYTSDLTGVSMIVGEYHSLKPEVEAKLGLKWPCNHNTLAWYLEMCGFPDVQVQPPSEMHARFHDGQQIGLFRASR